MITCLHSFRLDPYETERQGDSNMWETHSSEGKQELDRGNTEKVRTDNSPWEHPQVTYRPYWFHRLLHYYPVKHPHTVTGLIHCLDKSS